MFRDLHHDAKLLMVSRGIRAFAFSYLGVVFAIYLDRLGYSTVVVGMIFSVAYISSALLTAVWGYLSDRLGRRRILMLLAALTIVSNVIFIFFSSLFFILLAVVVASVGSGGSGGGDPAAALSTRWRRPCSPRSAAPKTETGSSRSTLLSDR